MLKKFSVLILLLLLFSGCSRQQNTQKLIAEQDEIVLLGNGIAVKIKLLGLIQLVEQDRDTFAIIYDDGLVISFLINQESVSKSLSRLKKVYQSLAIDYPDKYPEGSYSETKDVLINGSKFSVGEFSYQGDSAIEAYSKLNYRYSLEIYISGKNINPWDVLQQVSTYSLVSTRYIVPTELIVIAIICLLTAIYCVISKLVITHFYPKSKGKIINVVPHRRYISIDIVYLTSELKNMVGTYDTSPIDLIFFKNDQEVEITYHPKNMEKVYISTSKSKYIVGIFFLILFILEVYVILYAA